MDGHRGKMTEKERSPEFHHSDSETDDEGPFSVYVKEAPWKDFEGFPELCSGASAGEASGSNFDFFPGDFCFHNSNLENKDKRRRSRSADSKVNSWADNWETKPVVTSISSTHAGEAIVGLELTEKQTIHLPGNCSERISVPLDDSIHENTRDSTTTKRKSLLTTLLGSPYSDCMQGCDDISIVCGDILLDHCDETYQKDDKMVKTESLKEKAIRYTTLIPINEDTSHKNSRKTIFKVTANVPEEAVPKMVRWFGIVEPCSRSKDLCGALVDWVEKEPTYYFTLEEGNEFDRRFHYSDVRPDDFLRRLLGDGLVNCDESVAARDVSKLVVKDPTRQFVVEIGPTLRFRTPWCTNVLSACKPAKMPLQRIEMTNRYLVTAPKPVSDIQLLKNKFIEALMDPVLEQVYEAPIKTFEDQLPCGDFTWQTIPLLASCDKSLLSKVNQENAYGFDAQDISYYYSLFFSILKRDPTNVELCDLAQSNSEHSRHWFFKGKYQLEGKPLEPSMMKMIVSTNGETTNQNNVIKFHDNSSAISGFGVLTLEASDPLAMSRIVPKHRLKHLLLTAETHNFPTGVAPFSGAATGTGGRIRDVMAAGRGASVVAGIAGYCVGQLHIADYKMTWEREKAVDGHFEPALKIIIEASNGASDYGNKFGEPVIGGFFRAFGGSLGSERREWLKPIMFSAGIGMLDERHKDKTNLDGKKNLKIAKIGGPAYRIGMGGGAASSVEIQGAVRGRTVKAVQRGDPQMGNKLNRLVRACTEMENNPILSIHDQGAGGNSNVLKEIVDGHGAEVYADRFTLGDNTLTMEELWCAEYQESNAIICTHDDTSRLRRLAERERCLFDVVGTVVDSGTFRVIHKEALRISPRQSTCLDFPLDLVLGEVPAKTYIWTKDRQGSSRLEIPDHTFVEDVIENVLRLPSVASKRFLTSKVDRSVTGLVAQQQCVGERQLPLADLAVTACSYFSHEGIATSTGEQPIITLVDSAAGARMSLMEALASIVMAPITCLKDVKCSVNWMWPAKLPGEGYAMYEACKGLCELMKALGVAADGGKDSLGMAAQTLKPDGSLGAVVKAPGTVVVTAYAPCIDITKVVTPDIKGPRHGIASTLLWIRPVADEHCRLGGSALAQTDGGGALGVDVPDFTLEDVEVFIEAFAAMQSLVKAGKLLACHDVSEGGLLVCLIEMAMAGTCGLEVSLPVLKHQNRNHAKARDEVHTKLATLFSEEIGWVVEVATADADEALDQLSCCYCYTIGVPTDRSKDAQVKVTSEPDNQQYFSAPLRDLREAWEETSYRLELFQTARQCAEQEYEGFKNELPMSGYKVTFDYNARPSAFIDDLPTSLPDPPRVAVIREEGTNGDREMAAAFIMAGFHVFDVTMSDLFEWNSKPISFDDHNMDKERFIHQFKGLIFPGGFSYADFLGAAVGWNAGFKGCGYTNAVINEWKNQTTTFSLAVCNGCQLTALMGWQNLDTSDDDYDKIPDVRYSANKSRRFESRWCRLKIENTNSIFLTGMENSVLGVWVAHAEGQAVFKEETNLDEYKRRNMIAFSYVDDQNEVTERYPMNPNGSRGGVAGISSSCGRHLALMPHPERCVLPWQWPDKGAHPGLVLRGDNDPVQSQPTDTAPWAKIFQNAYDFCVGNKPEIQ